MFQNISTEVLFNILYSNDLSLSGMKVSLWARIMTFIFVPCQCLANNNLLMNITE